jgi:hypothetical protein
MRGKELIRGQLLRENPDLEDRIRRLLIGCEDTDPSAHWYYTGRWAKKDDDRKQIVVSLNGERVLEYVYRLMAALYVGDVPAGYEVAHDCQHPPCVRPEHLAIRLPADHRAMDRPYRRITKGIPKVKVILGSISRTDIE